MRLALIAALAANGVIGRDGDLPWHLPADLKRFKRLTMGHHLIVGRKTFEAIGRPLPGRTMVVVSRRSAYRPEGVEVVSSPEAAIALAAAAGDAEPFVAGGAQIYRHTLERTDRLYLTRVDAEIEGDAVFPPWNEADWELVECEQHPADERHAHAFRFEVYSRA